jgi:hypothetical protein
MATQNQVTELYPPNLKPERSWQEIAEEASKEYNSARLLELTDELLDSLSRDFD